MRVTSYPMKRNDDATAGVAAVRIRFLEGLVTSACAARASTWPAEFTFPGCRSGVPGSSCSPALRRQNLQFLTHPYILYFRILHIQHHHNRYTLLN